ncbi:2-deoxy-D-gluconate 3-dehydrogenase, partial [Vibrio alfacsensis]
MILDSFKLDGKVAVVTGCDTGLGQGMALGLAKA